MKLLRLILALAGFVGLVACSSDDPDQPENKPATKILVFYKTAGFHHESIPAGLVAIQKLGYENSFTVDTTNNADKFEKAQLAPYKAVIFLNTTGDILNETQQQAFETYIRAGKGFVGIHAATDTEYNWPWYNNLVGAYFNGHPAIQQATISVLNNSHPATKSLPATWERTDEWYNFKAIKPDIIVLANLEETTYNGGTNGSNHPIAWYHNFEGGRAFYTAGGHTSESYSEPLFLQHLLGGIKYAIGE
jgi:type 1 glutamine amidotransferase